MIHPIASRKTAASLLVMVCLTVVGQDTGHGQSPVEEGKIFWTHLERGIHRSSLDGSSVEQLVNPELRRPDKIALDVPGEKIYWADRRAGGIYRSGLDGSNTETLIEGDRFPGWTGISDIALNLDAGKIYWTALYSHGDYTTAEVLRANLDGSNIERLTHYLDHPEGLALDLVEGKMYWTAWEKIRRADLDGSNVEEVVTGFWYLEDIALDVRGEKIYWTNLWERTIQRADLDGSNIEEVVTGWVDFGTDITLDVAGGKIYWTDSEAGAIRRANLDGSDIEHLMEWEGVMGFALDLDQGRLYWTGNRGTIHRANLDGTNVEDLFAPEVRGPYGIALDARGRKMYWSDLVAGSIHRSDLDGSGIEVLITGLDQPKGMALSGGNRIYWADSGTGNIYWADSGTGKIQAGNVDGSQVEDIVTGLDRPDAVALDRGGSKIYWTEEGSIQRSNLNGSLVEAIVTASDEVDYYGAIALDRGRSKLYWTSTDWGRGTIKRSNLDGSQVEEVVTAAEWGDYGAIALDPAGNKIFWGVLTYGLPAEFFSPRPEWLEIYRSNLDGSQVEEIHSVFFEEGSSPAPTGIALDIPIPTSVLTHGTMPKAPAASGLEPNLPNPFNSATLIPYRLAASGRVRLEIYNTLGQRVRTLVHEVQPSGFYQAEWDARDQEGSAVSAGVYVTRLHYPGGVQTRRLLFLK